MKKGPSAWSWSYGSMIYNYLCNQCLSLLMFWVRIPLKRGVLETKLCNKVCQSLAAGRWFSPGTLVSSANKTDCHDIAEILLKVALNTITLTRARQNCPIITTSIISHYICVSHNFLPTVYYNAIFVYRFIVFKLVFVMGIDINFQISMKMTKL